MLLGQGQRAQGAHLRTRLKFLDASKRHDLALSDCRHTRRNGCGRPGRYHRCLLGPHMYSTMTAIPVGELLGVMMKVQGPVLAVRAGRQPARPPPAMTSAVLTCRTGRGRFEYVARRPGRTGAHDKCTVPATEDPSRSRRDDHRRSWICRLGRLRRVHRKGAVQPNLGRHESRLLRCQRNKIGRHGCALRLTCCRKTPGTPRALIGSGPG